VYTVASFFISVLFWFFFFRYWAFDRMFGLWLG